jgi:nucleoside-diphosphate-sugar epimerase
VRIFLAGASGAIGRRLTPLLLTAGHEVIGSTRSAETALKLNAAGIRGIVVDVFDAAALRDAVVKARPEIVIHQLTDLPRVIEDEAQLAASYPRNARIRTEGTRNLIAAAQAASARRFIVQSVAFAYAPGAEPHPETDPLNVLEGPRAVTVRAAADMERQVLSSGMEAIVLRYGFFNGPGTGTPIPFANRNSISMPRHRPHCWRSRAGGQASTTSPRRTGPSRLQEPAPSSATTRHSGSGSSDRAEMAY